MKYVWRFIGNPYILALVLITTIYTIVLLNVMSRHLQPTPSPWRGFGVGGMVLVNPTLKDSTGQARWVVLPRGSILMVPVPAPPDGTLTEN